MDPSDRAGPQKSDLRARFRARRRALTASERDDASAAVCQRLRQTPLVTDAPRLAGYSALGMEVDLSACLREFLDQGAQIFLPRVTGPGEMVFCPLTSFDDLAPGPFGIAEPRTDPVPTDTIDVFLVPGVAFDHRGHRLGFGKGFYDRALPPPGQAVAIGVAYEWQLHLGDLPVGDHDRPMDFLVTDQAWRTPPDPSPQNSGVTYGGT